MRVYLFLGLVAFGVAGGATLAAKRAQQQPAVSDPRIVVPLPSEWIPFSAQVRNMYPSGESFGTFHRRRDGSMAWILQTPGGDAITIHNVATQRSYVKVGTGPWRAYLLDHGVKLRPEPEIRLAPIAFRLVQDPAVGDVYEHTHPKTGQITRLSPGLNWTRLSLRRTDGTGQELFNIELGDPPDALFAPPAGEPVDEVKGELGRKGGRQH